MDSGVAVALDCWASSLLTSLVLLLCSAAEPARPVRNVPALHPPARPPARTRCMCTEHRFASASRQLLRGRTQPGALTVLQTPLIPGCSRVAGCRLGVNTDARLCLSCTKLTQPWFFFGFFQRQTLFLSVSESPFFSPLDFCKLNLKTVTIIQVFPSFLLFLCFFFLHTITSLPFRCRRLVCFDRPAPVLHSPLCPLVQEAT